MNFLNAIFGSSKSVDGAQKFWHPMESERDWEEAIERSYQQKVVIFKHSTRCFISKTVLRNFEKEVENNGKGATYYFLDLLAHRELSNKIAQDLGVVHQSPQLIVLENGKAVQNASHQAISIQMV